MRTRLDHARWLQQRQLPPHRILFEIKFRNLRRIPQRDKRPPPILRKLQRNRIRRRHRIALGQIETMLDVPCRRVDQQHIVCQILSNQQFLRTCTLRHRNVCRKRHSLVSINLVNQPRFLSGCELVKRQVNEPLRLNLAIGKSIHHDAAARVGHAAEWRSVAQGVIQRANARVYVTAVAAERQPGKQRLPCAQRCAVIGEIAHRAALCVVDRKRLQVLRFIGPVAGIHRHHVAPVRRNRHRHRQAVQSLRIARDRLFQLLARGQINTLCCVRLRSNHQQAAGDQEQ